MSLLRRHKTVVVALVVAVLAAAVAFCVGARLYGANEECDEDKAFINPEAACHKKYVLDKREYDGFREELIAYFDREKASGRISRYGVHFRDLDNGPTFSINQNEEFVPASLMKLPVMITYLNQAQEDPDILDEQLAFTWENPQPLEQYFKPEETIISGTAYTVRNLIHRMIAYSDNAAYEVLIQHLRDRDPEGDRYLATLQEIGIIEPTGNLDETLSPKSYASIFRTLYNASYLDPEYSELALSFLTESTFWAGLRGGVPDEVPIAHKFGERFGLANGHKELHDCGVVYYPDNPYLICVMVEGPDFIQLATVIRNVSDMVYDEVDSRRIR